jgi:hypothetical protein
VLFVAAKGGKPPTTVSLCLVATGSLGLGSLLGFIYGTFGQNESARFGPVFTAVAAALSGAAVVDLSRPNSGLNGAANLLGESCGLGPGAGGLVLCVVAGFFPPGFMLVFVYKALLINLRVSGVNSLIAELEASRAALRRSRDPLPAPDPSVGGVRRPSPPTDPETAAAAALIAGQEGAGKSGTPDKLRTDAKAFATLGDLRHAAEALERALQQKPDDTQLKFDLARVLVDLGNGQEREARLLLKDVVAQPQPPAAAWKLLGYVGLWGETSDDLRQAAEASRNYLSIDANDAGARLNLACALAQLAARGPEDDRDGYRAKAITELRVLLKEAPNLKNRVQDLAEVDFAPIRDDPEFKSLLA